MITVFREYIPDKEELKAFAIWAFGENFRDDALFDTGIDFMAAWNARHSMQLLLFPTGLISKDAAEMVQIWKDR